MVPVSEVTLHAAPLPTPRISSGDVFAKNLPMTEVLICNIFSGPFREDGIPFFAKQANENVRVVSYDTEIDINYDIADELLWKRLYNKLDADVFDGTGWAPPCSTFANARGNSPGERLRGPQPLRGATGNDRYGLQGLSIVDKDAVRLGTLLAVRTAAGLVLCLKKRIPFFYETPWPTAGKINMTLLDEFMEVVCHPEVVMWKVHQCRLDALTTKPTLLMTFLLEHDPEPLVCNHQDQWWVVPSSGITHHQPHPPLRGKEWAILYDSWDQAVWYPPPPANADWLTRSAAAYPARMNKMLATMLAVAAAKRHAFRNAAPLRDLGTADSLLSQSDMIRVGRWNNTLVRADIAKPSQSKDSRSGATTGFDSQVQFSARLRCGFTDTRAEDEKMAVGGLRRCSKSVDKIPGWLDIGEIIFNKLSGFLNMNPAAVSRAIKSIGTTDQSTVNALGEDIQAVREILVTTLQVTGDGKSAASEVYGGILEAWRLAARDPDWAVCSWFETGAPAGILLDIPACDIFPSYPDEDRDDPMDLITDFEDFVNHDASDEDDLAFTEFERITDKGWALKFGTLQEVVDYLGCEPVLSKVGIIEKVKGNVVKKRLVVDSKQAGITSATKKCQRALLPRTLDVVWDALDVLEHTSASEDEDCDVEFLVLDFSDAFFHVPNDFRERKFSVLKYRGVYYVLLRTAQGTRGAPLTWGRTAALVGRLTQGMLGTKSSRVNVYVDDPILALGGTRAAREKMMTMVILVWSALGFNLSFAKGKRGRSVQWVSARYDIWDGLTGITVSLKKEIEDDVKVLTSKMLALNVVPAKSLRSYAGKISHIASVLSTWRPFLQEVWAALKDCSSSNAPLNCIWVRQFVSALKWFDAFFSGSAGSTSRDYPLYVHLGQGDHIEINLDASPWGLGGYLEINGRILHYFISKVTVEEALLLGQVIGEASSQQTFEALAALVALRAWSHLWKAQRCVLKVRSDSISSLVVVLKLKTCGLGPGIVAREMALDVAEALYRPDVVEHVPGIANKVCDMLSRKHQPKATFSLPIALSGASETGVPLRDKAFYRSL